MWKCAWTLYVYTRSHTIKIEINVVAGGKTTFCEDILLLFKQHLYIYNAPTMPHQHSIEDEWLS